MTTGEPRSDGATRASNTRDQPATESITISACGIVTSGLVTRVSEANAALVLAHGAGAGMDHPHLERLAQYLAELRVACLRFNFPYRHVGGGRPDPAPRLEATVRAAVDQGRELFAKLPLFAGGRSLGARMTIRADAASPLGVHGLVGFAFPLHSPVNLTDPDPELGRAKHLALVHAPLLLLQGSRDRLAREHLVGQVTEDLERVTVHWIDTADHGFTPTRKSGQDQESVERELARVTRQWMDRVISLAGHER